MTDTNYQSDYWRITNSQYIFEYKDLLEYKCMVWYNTYSTVQYRTKHLGTHLHASLLHVHVHVHNMLYCLVLYKQQGIGMF